MSRPARLPEITAARFWPMRRISLGPSTSSIPATDLRKIGTPSRCATMKSLTSSTEASPIRTERTTMSISRSPSVKRVATSPCTLLRTVSATSPRLSPSWASWLRSKAICSSGLPSSAEDLTSTIPCTPLTTSRRRAAAACSSARLSL